MPQFQLLPQQTPAHGRRGLLYPWGQGGLGKITNKDSALTRFNDLECAEAAEEPRETRRQRMYRIREGGRRLIGRVTVQGAQPKYRMAWCGHRVQHDDWGDQRVSVMAEDGRAWYAGLYRCGDVWLCPQCAAKISAGRSDELAEAVIEASRQQMSTAMITYTFPHTRQDDLPVILAKFAKARSKLRSCRAWQRFTKRWGIVGEVKALEVTHSERNGWHPHAHNLTFFASMIPADRRPEFESDLYDAWRTVCIRADLPSPSREHGVHVQWHESCATAAADYVAKWSSIQELTGAQSKDGRLHGRNSWQLLDAATRGDRRAGELWLDFASAFHGRQQLRWSKGLRNRLKKQELFDSDLLDEGSAEARPVVRLDKDQWHVLCRTRGQDWLLGLVESGEPGEGIRGSLNAVFSSVPMAGGGYAALIE